MARGELEHVSKDAPCVVCSRHDWCCRLARYHLCMRVESDRPSPKGGWLHAKEAECAQRAYIPPRKPRKSDAELRDRFAPFCAESEKNALDKLERLSVQLAVSVEALRLLHVGYAVVGDQACWTFPERNHRGWIVGVTRRLVAPKDGQRGKLCMSGSRRALTYCDGWDKFPGPIYLVEGGSDTAAGLTLGLCVVGRPSNVGGIDMLASLLRPHRRRIIVVGERDQKSPLYVSQANPRHNPMCRGCLLCWPGHAGMVQTTKAIAERMGRSVGTIMPPVGFKDLRSFVQSLATPEEQADAVRQLRNGRFPTARPQGSTANP